MKKQIIAVGASLLMSTASTHAEGIRITTAGSSPTITGDPRNFSGHVAVDIKVAGDSSKHGSVGIVDFMPGARTAWHTHPVGQLLVVTEGKGWVQEEGQPKREIKAGDVVWIESGIRHWHGAAQDHRMSHLAIAYVREGKSSDWQELVSEEQYNVQ